MSWADQARRAATGRRIANVLAVGAPSPAGVLDDLLDELANLVLARATDLVREGRARCVEALRQAWRETTGFEPGDPAQPEASRALYAELAARWAEVCEDPPDDGGGRRNGEPEKSGNGLGAGVIIGVLGLGGAAVYFLMRKS